MQLDQFLVQFASSVSAAILMLIAAAGVLLLKDRKAANRLVVAFFALGLFLITRLAVNTAAGHAPMLEDALRVAGLVFFAFALVRMLGVAIVDVFLTKRTGVETPRIIRDMIVAGLYMLATVSVLRLTLKVDLTSFLTTAGLLSIVLGMALQDTLGNLFSGLAMQIERPFGTGDWISFGDTNGKVVELGWRATTVLTRSQDLVIVPNNVLTKLEITNHTRPTRVHGLTQEIGLAYSIPPSVAKEVILSTLSNLPGIVADPAPGVAVKGFGDFSVTYIFKYFIDNFDDAPMIQSSVYSALWYSLKRAGLEIPFPIRHVYTHIAAPSGGASEMTETLFADAERLLAEVDFLAPLDGPTRAQLARRMRAMQYGKGETVVHVGDTGEHFYLIDDGSVSVRLQAGAEVATLSRGQFFGEMSLLTGEPRSATVVAKADTLLLTLDRAGFREVLIGHPQIAGRMAELLASRTQQNVAVTASGAHRSNGTDGKHILGKLKELLRL